MMRRMLALVVLALVACACDASYPTTPSELGVVGLQLQLQNPFGNAIVGSTYNFAAYALRSDTAWENVSGKSDWRTSNIGVLRPAGANGAFNATGIGIASILVRYQGFLQSLDVTVIEAPDRPRISVGVSQRFSLGDTGTASAFLFSASGAFSVVTGDTAYASSDPRVLAVDGTRLTALAIGTATITGTYQGLSDFVRVSVAPR